MTVKTIYGRRDIDDGKPCVTSVTIILFENNFRQTSRSFKQILFAEEQKTSILSEFPAKHSSNSPVTFVSHKAFCRPLLPAVLSRKLTIITLEQGNAQQLFAAYCLPVKMGAAIKIEGKYLHFKLEAIYP